jgi:ribosome production factor 1
MVEDDEEDESDEEDDEEADEDMPEAGPSTLSTQPAEATAEAEVEAEKIEQPLLPTPTGPPRILITTSPSATKDTYAFCEDLKNIFPGGEFFKRPKGRGFELGRISRWAAKRQYHALVIVNEDHKSPSKLSNLHICRSLCQMLSLSSTCLQAPLLISSLPVYNSARKSM